MTTLNSSNRTKALRNGALALAALTALAGCQTYGGPREGIGALGGAVAGGLIGNQIGSGSGQVLATVGGAVLGRHLLDES